MNYLGFDDYSYQGNAFGQGSYVTLKARGPVSKWVQCFWLLNVPDGRYTFRGVPGNNIDCIFMVPGSEGFSFPVLPLSEPAFFRMQGPITFFGIRLRVLAQHWLMPTPLGEWNGDDLRTLLGERLLDKTFEILAKKLSFQTTAEAVGQEFFNQILLNNSFGDLGGRKIDARVQRFLDYAHSNETSSLKLGQAECSDLAVSSRHLRRLCNQFLGLGPRDFYRVIRFQRMLHQLQAPQATAIWADHYHDQPHFIREFRSLTGLTPIQFQKSSVLYNTP